MIVSIHPKHTSLLRSSTQRSSLHTTHIGYDATANDDIDAAITSLDDINQDRDQSQQEPKYYPITTLTIIG